MSRADQILAYLRQHGERTVKDITAATGIPKGTAMPIMYALLEAGLVDRRYLSGSRVVWKLGAGGIARVDTPPETIGTPLHPVLQAFILRAAGARGGE